MKRRCSAANVMTLIEHSRRPEVMSKHALTLCLGKCYEFKNEMYSNNIIKIHLFFLHLDNLVKDFKLNIIVGALGLLRVLLPKILLKHTLELCVVHKIIEIYEICLHFLNDGNHTIINASLECLCVILSNSKSELSNLLMNDKLIHMEVLCKKRSLKNQIFRRKQSTSSIEISKQQLSSSQNNVLKSKRSMNDVHSSTVKELDNSESDVSNVLDYVTTHTELLDDKGLLTGSDIELDSMRLNDFELNQSNESLVQLSERISPAIKRMTQDAHSLKSQKSIDSVGSFFNTLIHPNTGECFCYCLISCFLFFLLRKTRN